MAKHFLSDPAEHQASHQAAVAWNALKKAAARTLPDWERVGRGFLAGRSWAMREAGIPAGTNALADYRLGRIYNEKFGEWLRAYKLDDIDQAARTNILKLMDNPVVLAWRNGQPEAKRQHLNHPTTIMRAYARAQAAKSASHPEKKAEDETKKSSTRETALDAMRDKLDIQTAELAKMKIAANKRCDVDLLHSDMIAIEEWLRMRVLSEEKATRIRDVLIELYPLSA